MMISAEGHSNCASVQLGLEELTLETIEKCKFQQSGS